MSAIAYPHIAERVFNAPLLIMPQKLDAMLFGLSGRFGIDGAQVSPNVAMLARTADLSPDAVAKDIGAYTTYVGEFRKPGYRVVKGVGVIDVYGVLAHRGGFAADSSYILGYQQIARQFETAMADPEVESILFSMDSPGGEVAGVYDLADQIRSARGTKPIHAIASDLSASACYLLGSACDELSITQTGWAGSIGVVMRHADFSARLDADGIKVTHIFAGAHKVDGNPYEALPKAVRAKFQSEIDALYTMFVSTVANYRDISEDDVRNTEAEVFMGQAAVDAGLADRIETPDQLINRLAAQTATAFSSRATARQSGKETAMSEKDKQTSTAETPTVTQADHEAAVAAAQQEGHAAGVKAGAEQERERISAILAHESAKGRESMAVTLATETDMTAEQAGKVLAAAPAAQASKGNLSASDFGQMMAGNNPKAHPDASTANDDEMADAELVAQVYALKGGK